MDEIYYALLMSVRAIKSQLFPPRDHLSISNHHNLASELETVGSQSATNPPDMITISVVVQLQNHTLSKFIC